MAISRVPESNFGQSWKTRGQAAPNEEVLSKTKGTLIEPDDPIFRRGPVVSMSK
jgi:hypothetical protein